MTKTLKNRTLLPSVSTLLSPIVASYLEKLIPFLVCCSLSLTAYKATVLATLGNRNLSRARPCADRSYCLKLINL